MSSERLQPLYVDAAVLPSLPANWSWSKFEDVAVTVPVGRKYDGKSVVKGGIVPVIDQSISGVMGHHNDEPGVNASGSRPVFTFANHTCAMRWMTHSFSCIQNVFAFRGSDRCDTRYLYYASQGRVVLEEYKGHAPTFRAMYVPVPPLSEQRDIGEILASLDNRVDLLHETNATLEAIAQALFKSWFVDFDPVHAKMAGRAPEGMDDATAALFPDALEETELGLVPKGWCNGKVSDLGDVVCGKTPPTSCAENYGGDIPFITIPDMHGLLAVTATARSLSRQGADSQAKKYLPAGAVCVSCIATPGLVVQVTKLSQTNQQINSVIPFDLWGKAFPLFLLRRVGGAVRMGGAGGSVFHNLSKSGFEAIGVLLPSHPLAQAFNDCVEPLVQRIVENQRQVEVLSDLRDTLLPRLISGQLRPPELLETEVA